MDHIHNDNLYKYARYVNSNQETRWATTEEIKRAGTYIDLSADSYPVAGLPLLSNGKEAYVDGKDTHTLIFGATGSKKTRLFCMPMLNLFAKAGESFVATDPKGELYHKTSGLMKENGYDIVVLNFREIGKGDRWNPLSTPYRLYKSGNVDGAVTLLNDFISTVAEPQMANSKDLFWPEMASSLMLAHLMLLMDSATEDQATIASLAKLCSINNESALKRLASHMDPDSIAGLNYNGTFSSAPDTLKSIYATLFSMIRIFNTQKNLTDMLSGNTIDIKSFGQKKTAVYIIVPDEKTTYHFLVTTFIKQVYEILVDEAQKNAMLRLPVRVNFVLDEFCNMPKIADMPTMISASRSRNMRFFLVAQSLHQLRSKYGEDADTIKGNCDNWVFLTSKELSLLNEISELCGTIHLPNNMHRRLISVSELQRLDKDKGEALIMHARQYPIITEIADIDMYEMFKGFDEVEVKPFTLTEAPSFSVALLLEECRRKKRRYPFSKDNGDGDEDENEDTPSSGSSWTSFDDWFND